MCIHFIALKIIMMFNPTEKTWSFGQPLLLQAAVLFFFYVYKS